MKVLVIGSGGREHALVWKLRQSPQVEHVWCAPGNGGISLDAECVAADVKNVVALADLASKLTADLTLVGPESPLVSGIVDEFERRRLPIVGPSKRAAELEGSKVYAKEFLARHNIPTAGLVGIFDTPGDAYSALCAVDWPVVIKADGLCAGKGVLVAPTPDDATAFIDRLMEQREFGEAGDRLIIEEGLTGQELSYIILTDGESFVPMAPTRDHKRAFDGDKGPNTGGMGAFSTDDLLSKELEETIVSKIVNPTLKGMAADGTPYRGFLYFGLMITSSGPQVLEYNCRLGDPETQAIMARVGFDLMDALNATLAGKLGSLKPSWTPAASACVVMASGGYPESYQTGKRIEGLPTLGGRAKVFHAGTKREGESFLTSGGRVLGVTAWGPDLGSAIKASYDICSTIKFERAHYRKDIGPNAERVRAAG